MSMNVKNKTLNLFLLALGLLISVTSYAGYENQVKIDWGYPNLHHHDDGYERLHHRGSRYGYGWGGPNVIINVPVERHYAPRCEQVEVCDAYDECWLERYCH